MATQVASSASTSTSDAKVVSGYEKGAKEREKLEKWVSKMKARGALTDETIERGANASSLAQNMAQNMATPGVSNSTASQAQSAMEQERQALLEERRRKNLRNLQKANEAKARYARQRAQQEQQPPQRQQQQPQVPQKQQQVPQKRQQIPQKQQVSAEADAPSANATTTTTTKANPMNEFFQNLSDAQFDRLVEKMLEDDRRRAGIRERADAGAKAGAKKRPRQPIDQTRDDEPEDGNYEYEDEDDEAEYDQDEDEDGSDYDDYEDADPPPKFRGRRGARLQPPPPPRQQRPRKPQGSRLKRPRGNPLVDVTDDDIFVSSGGRMRSTGAVRPLPVDGYRNNPHLAAFGNKSGQPSVEERMALARKLGF